MAFHLARLDLPEVKAMAELFPIDQIFDNPAYPTLLANAFIGAGIRAAVAVLARSQIPPLNLIQNLGMADLDTAPQNAANIELSTLAAGNSYAKNDS
jgi:hypothetical protein